MSKDAFQSDEFDHAAAVHKITKTLLQLSTEVIDYSPNMMPSKEGKNLRDIRIRMEEFATLHRSFYEEFNKKQSFKNISSGEISTYRLYVQQMMQMSISLIEQLRAWLSVPATNILGPDIKLLEQALNVVLNKWNTLKYDLNVKFQSTWQEVIRIQRMINAKIAWLSYLKKKLTPILSWQEKIKLAIAIRQEKFSWFKKFVETQSLESVFRIIRCKLKVCSSESDIYSELIKRNQQLESRIQELEQLVDEPGIAKQSLLMILGSGKILLDASLGKVTFQIMQTAIQRKVKNPWPESWTSFMEYLSAFIWLSMDINLMRWTGSCYRLVSAMSCNVASTDGVLPAVLYRLDRHLSAKRYLKFRADELGIIENQLVIQEIFSFLIHLLLSVCMDNACLPAAMGYVTAMFFKKITVWGVTSVGKYNQWSSRTIETTGRTAELLSFTVIYKWVFEYCFSMVTAFSARSRAFDVLGLKSDMSQEEIAHIVRRLVLKFHPDKCATAECAEQYEAVMNAKQVLSMS